MRLVFSLFAACLLLAVPASAHVAADQSKPTTLVTHELRAGKFHRLSHPVRVTVTVAKNLGRPTRAQRAAARRAYRAHRQAHAAYHHTCNHSGWFYSPYGGYHAYIGWGTYPWVHTHYYNTYSPAGGINFRYPDRPMLKRLLILTGVLIAGTAIPTTANAAQFVSGGARCQWRMDFIGHYSPTYNVTYVYGGNYGGWRLFYTTAGTYYVWC